MCLDQMLQPWEQAESHNQFQNSLQLIQILVYFMTPFAMVDPVKKRRRRRTSKARSNMFLHYVASQKT